MFMRYRGGGVGHKYMREIEVKYENMSLECSHWNPRPKPPRGGDTSAPADDASSGEEETEDPGLLGRSERNEEGDAVQPAGLREDQQPERASGTTVGGLCGDESDDGDYVPPQTGESDDGETSTSYKGDSDNDGVMESEGDPDEIGSNGGYESYGLAEL